MKLKGAGGVGDYDDAISPVPADSSLRTIFSLATQLNMFTDHVHISQAFVQGELLPGDGHKRKGYSFSLLGCEEDSRYIYRLLRPLYGMLSAARAWHTTMSAFVEREGCEPVVFEKSMWRVVIDSHRIPLGAHINDFVIACANRPVLDAFRKRLLEAFEGTYEDPSEHYLGCEIAAGPGCPSKQSRQDCEQDALPVLRLSFKSSTTVPRKADSWHRPAPD